MQFITGYVMKFSDLMTYYDYKVSNVMRALNVSRTAVDSWKRKNHIPFKMQCVIQVITKGELKADLDEWTNNKNE